MDSAALYVTVKGNLFFKVSHGPYQTGEMINISCEVPRVKGDISANNLSLFLGNLITLTSSMSNNSDGTQRLSIYERLHVKPEYNNEMFTCRYLSCCGTVSLSSAAIKLSGGEYFFRTLAVTGQNPPGHVPPGHLPQGHIPPGHLSPGHLPPGHLPPRTHTPWSLTPRTLTPQTLTP